MTARNTNHRNGKSRHGLSRFALEFEWIGHGLGWMSGVGVGITLLALLARLAN